ncbi:MAG TPA: hypothetical protein VMW01_02485 [Williamwhitmania sp.]|nr:hypothetical protein [Williamwhitmania sp.]
MLIRSSLREAIRDPYIQINLIFAGVVVAMLIYSGIFTGQGGHPIPSFYEMITGTTSPSSGLSRAFSELVRFNVVKARALNSHAVSLFLFFVVELLLRIVFSAVVCVKHNHEKIIVSLDIVQLVLYFSIAFFPFFAFFLHQF